MRPVVCLTLSLVLLASFRVTAAEEDVKKDLKLLQGAWSLSSMELSKDKLTFSDRPPVWSIKGNKVFYGGKQLATLTLHDTVKPRSIDVTFSETKKVYEGVYSVEKDMFKLCVNRLTEGVKERPESLSVEDKPEFRLLTFTRANPGAEKETEKLPGFVGLQLRAEKADRIIVEMILKGSPAEKAGLKKGDVILKVGDHTPENLQKLVRHIQQAKPGGELLFRIERDEKAREITVKVGVLPFLLFM